MSRPSRCIRRTAAAGRRLGHLYTSWHSTIGAVCSWCMRPKVRP